MADPARLLFVVGAPRSGTTWLQGMLGDRPEIATPQETDLFRLYLDPVVQAWNRQVTAASTESGRRRKGLPFVLTEAEFLTATGALLSSVLAAVLRMKPTAEVVVEKSPAHSLSIDTIVRYAPEARFIHMVRDGRDAAASMVAASSDWGSRWAAPTVGRGARVWKQYVEAARTATGCGSGYLELRYEDLRGDRATSLLQSVVQFAGVTVSQSEAAEALHRQSFERQADEGGRRRRSSPAAKPDRTTKPAVSRRASTGAGRWGAGAMSGASATVRPSPCSVGSCWWSSVTSLTTRGSARLASRPP